MKWFQISRSSTWTEGALKAVHPENNVEALDFSLYQTFLQIPPTPFLTSTYCSLKLLNPVNHVLGQPSISAAQSVFPSALTQSSGPTSLNSSIMFRTRFPLQKIDIQTRHFWLLSWTREVYRTYVALRPDSKVREPSNLSKRNRVLIICCFHLLQGEGIYHGSGKPLFKNKGFTVLGRQSYEPGSSNMITKWGRGLIPFF